MKKRIMSIIVWTCIMSSFVACSNKESVALNEANMVQNDVVQESDTKTGDDAQVVSVDPEQEHSDTKINEDTVTAKTGESNTAAPVAVAKAATEIAMVTLPDGIIGMKSESAPNEELRKLIIEYYEIPKEFYETTRYYYNYVDLNNDGTDEIFAVVMGPYTSGTGGSSALWVIESAGKLHVNQNFTLFNTPVIISDTITNGAKELIVPYYGGDAESQYSVLTCKDGYYSRVSEGNMINSLDGVTGIAIIANDIYGEIEAGNMGLNLLGE